MLWQFSQYIFLECTTGMCTSINRIDRECFYDFPSFSFAHYKCLFRDRIEIGLVWFGLVWLFGSMAFQAFCLFVCFLAFMVYQPLFANSPGWLVGWLVSLFNDISTFVVYLMPNPFS